MVSLDQNTADNHDLQKLIRVVGYAELNNI
jgi:hypothetical protein